MSQPPKIAIWMQQIRAPFLILSIVLVLIGSAAAHHAGISHLPRTLLLMAGIIFAHIAVNLFNEISDFKTKIDENTKRTPFSGGSGMLQTGRTTLARVQFVAYSSLFLAAAAGLYFCVTSGWSILIFMLIGGFSILFYTSHLSHLMLGELFSGLTLGSLVVLGTYFALTSTITNEIIFISIPPGILTSLLLLLNEIPDMEADKQGGRNHLVIKLGREKSVQIYTVFIIITYMMILAAPFFMGAPKIILISLLTMPLAVNAVKIAAKSYDDLPNLIPALGMNVGLVIITDLLLAIGYFI